MRLIDLYYRAFNAFRKHTQNNSDSQKERKAITYANMKDDQFTSIKYTCEIDEDWIKNIEEGLIYIEKAIREERQFIRSEGEVVIIEKVKRTSKASVEHLARHSGLITRLPKNEDDPVVPDKLYMVEKLSDFAVYENKFLYMLLEYLKVFINIRIDNIKDKVTTYQSNMSIRKEIKMNNRHINYYLTYSDLNHNDPYLLDAYQKLPLVTRIETIYAIVNSLLSTPLMMEVSKAPMIKPPIVKTNVLRMNQNFKAALRLYDYITSYNKDGYSFKEVKKTYNPFPDEMSDEIAETIGLTSFLAYKYGNDIKADLLEVYNNEEKKIKEAEEQQKVEEIKRLKKRIVEMNEDPAEYMLALEKRNRNLEKLNSDLDLEKQRNAEYKLQINTLEKEKENLNDAIKNMQSEVLNKNEEIDKLNRKYYEDLTSGEQIHRQEIKALNEEHLKQKAAEQESLIKKYDEIINGFNTQIQKLKETITSYENQMKELEIKMQQIEEDKRYATGRLHALKYQQGLMTDADDFTSKEKFKELELEMIAYKKFFNEQWKKTKYKIRKKAKEENLLSNRKK